MSRYSMRFFIITRTETAHVLQLFLINLVEVLSQNIFRDIGQVLEFKFINQTDTNTPFLVLFYRILILIKAFRGHNGIKYPGLFFMAVRRKTLG